MKRILFLIIILVLLSACTSAPAPTQTSEVSETSEVFPSPVPTLSNQSQNTSTPDTSHLTPDTPTPVPPTATLAPDAWQQMPVIPVVSEAARLIHQNGLALGRDPQRFSKAGDCESTTGWYLSTFDTDPPTYSLGEQYSYLQPTIDYYAGSFERESIAVRRGANTASMLTSFWADPNFCEAGESMLACEYRVQNPSVALIAVGTNDALGVDNFEEQLRRIIEFTIAQGIVPVLSTKADNAEGDHSINAIVAKLAYEYDIPLWNFWLAVQPLPNHGLQDDGFHLTFAGNYFDDPFRMEAAWPWRNLTALQILDAVRIALEK
ncbi:MAG: SGNH/GDSL hydrolase family protein [Chloroflexi bacterium]|nr:SGNH/GDSL hydrolase family protein [Chloroflexota bacterium]